jgi:hypothetical protein
MIKKSQKLYAILVSTKSEIRDEKLSGLFGEEYQANPDFDSIFVMDIDANKTITSTSKICYIKKWKTEAGVRKAFDSIENKNLLKIVEITELWNEDIERRIVWETEEHKKKIESLKKSKI